MTQQVINIPTTRYTKSVTINIAYQIFGSSPVDLVYIPSWIFNIDWMWACPELASFLTVLEKRTRIVLFVESPFLKYALIETYYCKMILET